MSARGTLRMQRARDRCHERAQNQNIGPVDIRMAVVNEVIHTSLAPPKEAPPKSTPLGNAPPKSKPFRKMLLPNEAHG